MGFYSASLWKLWPQYAFHKYIKTRKQIVLSLLSSMMSVSDLVDCKTGFVKALQDYLKVEKCYSSLKLILQLTLRFFFSLISKSRIGILKEFDINLLVILTSLMRSITSVGFISVIYRVSNSEDLKQIWFLFVN